MKAIVATDQAAGTAGVKLVERPEPQPAINDVLVQIHASGFTGDELTWPSTWTDRAGRDRTPSIPGQFVSGDRRRTVTTDAIDPGRGPCQFIPGERRRINLNNDLIYRRLRVGSLQQLHPGGSRSLIRRYDRIHRLPPCVECLPAMLPSHSLLRNELSDRNGSIQLLASPASVRDAAWPSLVCFMGIVSLVGCATA